MFAYPKPVLAFQFVRIGLPLVLVVVAVDLVVVVDLAVVLVDLVVVLRCAFPK